MDKGTASIGIGAKPKKKNQDNAQSSTSTVNMTFQQMFGVDSIRKDWSMELGVIGEVLNQKDKDICWAIVFARLLQAIYNYGRDPSLHMEFSYKDLLSFIKPKATKKFQITNYNRVINHVATRGMLKKPIRASNERPGFAGAVRIARRFEHLQDVGMDMIIGKLNIHPIGLIVETTRGFYSAKEGIYIPVEKGHMGDDENFHVLLIIGWGVTDKGDRYLIGQNSWGETWGFKGYVRIVLKENYDIICHVEE